MVTLKEIAQAVGVSSATVSRVLNLDASLSITEAKRQAIIETAEALNYATPRARNRAAPQGLQKIALIHFLDPEQELSDPYYVGLRLGIERRCEALRIEAVKVYKTGDMPDANLLRSASGTIAIGYHDPATIDWIKTHSNHVVFADFALDTDDADAIYCDLGLATRKLLQGLSEAGYERIGFVGWDECDANGRRVRTEKRMRAYKQWMSAHGRYDENMCLTEDNSEQSSCKLTKKLLALKDRPEAIIACNDSMAVGAYRAIAEAGLSIPGEIAVASFNDIPVAQFLNPGLTTVRLPAEEIGEGAVDLLVERAAGRQLSKQVNLASQLIWRASTHRPASARATVPEASRLAE